LEDVLRGVEDIVNIGETLSTLKIILLVGLGIVAILSFINMLFLMAKLDKMERQIERIEIKLDMGRGERIVSEGTIGEHSPERTRVG
jgi:uncharacterized membrane protein YciS (DUF1049 family)